MSVQKLMTNYAAYNAWANESLVNWLKTKPQDVLFAEVPSSFSSILKTLNHVCAVEEFWLAVITEIPFQGAPRYIATEFDPEEIMGSLAASSKFLADYIASLEEEDFQKMVNLDTPWAKGLMPRYEFIQHTFNHSTYHRGQITTIGRNVGLTDAPMSDYNFFNMVVSKRAGVGAISN